MEGGEEARAASEKEPTAIFALQQKKGRRIPLRGGKAKLPIIRREQSVASDRRKRGRKNGFSPPFCFALFRVLFFTLVHGVKKGA